MTEIRHYGEIKSIIETDNFFQIKVLDNNANKEKMSLKAALWLRWIVYGIHGGAQTWRYIC